jgi:hypothetical protein
MEALPCGLKRGMLKDDVVQRLGEPDERDGENQIYRHRSDGGPEDMILHMDNGKLNGIKWSFYFD